MKNLENITEVLAVRCKNILLANPELSMDLALEQAIKEEIEFTKSLFNGDELSEKGKEMREITYNYLVKKKNKIK